VTVLLTVSPVRHLRDGFIENTRSKAHLLSAIHEVVDKKSIFYFPSFEIMMDDLRDYRFYAHDMLHPSSVAIDYIWDQFSKTYFERETFDIIKEVNQIVQAKNHRPLNPTAENHQKFVKNQISKIQELSKRYSFINFENEQKYFENLKI
jgi:hypothetical protein